MDATGTVTFSVRRLPALHRDAPRAQLPDIGERSRPGTYPVTATYSGDGQLQRHHRRPARAFTVTKADPSFTEAAAPATVPYGTADTLSAAGLPGDATGSGDRSGRAASDALRSPSSRRLSCQTVNLADRRHLPGHRDLLG